MKKIKNEISKGSGKVLINSFFICAILTLFLGCASAKVKKIGNPASKSTPKPDYIIVENLLVDPVNIAKDQSLLLMMGREFETTPQNKKEKIIGEKVAKVFSNRLVKDLRKVGIKAYKAIEKKKVSKTTLILKGTFLRVDKGNRTLRVLIGFGLGGSRIDALLSAWQNGKQIAMAEVKTTASKKPGVAAPIGIGGAVGTLVTSAAVSGGTAVLGELATAIENDASNAASEVAKVIAKAYVKRGWLAKENLKKIDGWF